GPRDTIGGAAPRRCASVTTVVVRTPDAPAPRHRSRTTIAVAGAHGDTRVELLTREREILRGTSRRVPVRRVGELLRHRRLVGRGADGPAIRGGRARRGGALHRPGGGCVRHAHGRPLLRGAAGLGDCERALARGLERGTGPRRRRRGGDRVHVGRHPAGAPAVALCTGAGRLAVALRLST